jgi:N-acetylneuraminate synthase
MTGSVCVIAEAGVNHNGSVELAEALVRAAAAAGADIVKFQTFKAEELVTSSAPMAKYQERNIGAAGPQLAMLKKLELDRTKLAELSQLAESLGIELISTPFDIESVQFLVRDVKVKRLKIGSGDLTNAPLLLVAARTGKPIVLSTGMATLDEVEAALSVIAFGYAEQESKRPSKDAFKAAFGSEGGKSALRDKVTILQCTTEYPAPFESINLRAMDTLAGAFGCAVGLSDHSEGFSAAVAAVARGAVMIEKHLTLDRGMEGPDHRASLEPDEFAEMVRAVRQTELALGDGKKAPADAEKGNMYVARKSLVTTRPVLKGQTFTAENLGAKRPGGGVEPMEYWARLGTEATRDYRADEQIDP